MDKKPRNIIFLSIGVVEIAIGFATLIGCSVAQFFVVGDIPVKPHNVFVFVISTAVISLTLGVGLLSKREWARILLIFFSGYIILSKVLIYSGLLFFNGSVAFIIPTWARDAVSAAYHAAVIALLYLSR